MSTPIDSTPVGPGDALLVLSFGGPERMADVRPFLENVTRGRGIPAERLDAVGEHYRHFGGVSPINARNRELIAAVRVELQRADMALPVYFGNRNWHPLVADAVAEMAADGVHRAFVLVTSAYGGYSACRQYREDIVAARETVQSAAGPAAVPELITLPHFFDHPSFIAANADAVRAARATLPPELRDAARLVFTAHSVPVAADASAGTPAEGGHRYSRQVAEAARLVAAELGEPAHDLVWQSRSGPPAVPWLAPDIGEHLDELHRSGVAAVVVCPVGFISDHIEVVWDLDVEAARRADALGLGFARAATAGSDPRFAKMVVELIRFPPGPNGDSHHAGWVPHGGCGVNGAPCAPDCCLPIR